MSLFPFSTRRLLTLSPAHQAPSQYLDLQTLTLWPCEIGSTSSAKQCSGTTTSLRLLSPRVIANDCSRYVCRAASMRAPDMKQLRSTKQLLGRAGERFLLFGMLAHNKEGKLCLEDQDGSVELDFSQLVSETTRGPGKSAQLYATGPTQ